MSTALVDASHWRGVVRVFDAACEDAIMRKRITARLYTDLFYAFMKIGTVSAATRVYHTFKRVCSAGADTTLLGPRSFNFIYVLLSRHNFIEKARHVHERCMANGYYLNRYSYNSFLNACAKRNRVMDAFLTLRAMADNDIAPDVVSCNVLIACCVRSREIDMALRVLQRMPEWGITPDIYSYNSVINGLRKSRMMEEAFDLVARMEIAAGDPPIEGRQPHGNIKRADEPVRPDLVTFNTLISGLAASDEPNLSRAYAVHKHMVEGGIEGNEVTYNALMATAARAKRVDAAFSLYREMKAKELEPNCECYTTLITLCGQVGQVERAFRIHADMIENKVQPTVVSFNALLTALRRGDKKLGADVALEVVSVMKKTEGCDPDVITYSTVIDALGRDGRFKEIKELLDEMISSGVQPNLVTYTTLVSAMARNGDLDGAAVVLREMEEAGFEPNVYTFSCMVTGAARHNKFERGIGFMRTMQMRGINVAKKSYMMLLQMCVMTGNKEGVGKVLAEMRKDGRLVGSSEFGEVEELLTSSEMWDGDKGMESLAEVYGLLGTALHEGVGQRDMPKLEFVE